MRGLQKCNMLTFYSAGQISIWKYFIYPHGENHPLHLTHPLLGTFLELVKSTSQVPLLSLNIAVQQNYSAAPFSGRE